MKKDPSQEEIIEQVEKLLEERGRKGLELARKEILQEEIECKEVREALHYFITQYWHDTARPALLSLVCEAVGGDPDITIPIAAGMTLISGATDIHDDIIDLSEIKESRQTVLGKFGKEVALLAGDALLFKGFTLLIKAIKKRVTAEKMTAAIDVVQKMFFEMGDAEALELQFRGRMDVPPEEYLHIVRKKAADVEACTRLSAIIGGGSEKEIDALGEYGRMLGMIFILRDDFTDIVDFEEFLHRLKKECLPLPILFALQNPGIKDNMLAIFSKEKVTEGDAKMILNIIREANALQQLRKLLEEIAANAYSSIKNIQVNRRYLEMLIEAVILPLD